MGHPDTTQATASATAEAALGRVIRRLRRARGLSIETLAFAAEMHPTYLSGIERGVRNPSWGKLSDLAHALDLPLERLAHEAEEEAIVARVAEAARAHLRAQSAGLTETGDGVVLGREQIRLSFRPPRGHRH
jgi:transcriptional regulator with XRE-family HTH domain